MSNIQRTFDHDNVCEMRLKGAKSRWHLMKFVAAEDRPWAAGFHYSRRGGVLDRKRSATGATAFFCAPCYIETWPAARTKGDEVSRWRIALRESILREVAKRGHGIAYCRTIRACCTDIACHAYIRAYVYRGNRPIALHRTQIARVFQCVRARRTLKDSSDWGTIVRGHVSRFPQSLVGNKIEANGSQVKVTNNKFSMISNFSVETFHRFYVLTVSLAAVGWELNTLTKVWKL